MLRRQRQIHTQIHKLVDAGLFALGLRLSHWIRETSGISIFGGSKEIQAFEQYIWIFLLLIPLTPFLLDMQGFYRRPLLSSRRQTAWQLSWACFWATMAIILFMFLLRIQLARAVFILFGPISFALVFLKEEIIRHWLSSEFGHMQAQKRLILAGTIEDTKRFRSELKTHSREEMEIAAEIDLNSVSIEELVELLHEKSVNAVILSGKHTYFGQIEKAIQACELEGVEVWLLADFFKTQISQTTVDDFYGRPMMVFRSAPEVSWQGVAKQTIDVIGAILLLIATSPIFLVVAILIKRTSPGPILFRQSRSGLNGRPFTMLKFRTMTSDAEQRKHELAQLNEMSGPVFKVTNDPRITRIGHFLRRKSIDELPQLINVIKGEMSLVGPRPLPVDEVRRFDDLAHRRRLSVKPGLTCLWQISGRNQVTDFRDWVRLDLEYIDNWSLWLDVKILCRTVPVVLLGTGAK